MNTMSKNQSKTCAETHELNYLYQKSDTVRGGFRGGGGGWSFALFTGILPPADPKGPPLYYFEIFIFG